MDKKISEIFDYGDEIVVEEQVDLFDPAEIKELTMRKIHGENAPYKAKGVKKAYRTLLIAAVITVLLVGTAVAAYQLSMKDVQVGEPYTYTPSGLPDTQQERRQDISLNGLVSSPEYQAYAEWTAWNEEWREENPNPWAELGVDDAWHETPDNYAWLYDAYFNEQAEKLDEIADKYGLSLHTICATFDTEEELCDVLDISDIWRGKFEGISGGYIYDDGTFKFDSLDAASEKSSTICLSVDGSFTLIGASIPADYNEWSYETADGIQVALAMTDFTYDMPSYAFARNAWLVAKLDKAMITVFAQVETRKELEAYADCINLAELSELFSAGADRSFISAAVEAQRAAYEQKEAEQRAAEAAAMAAQAEYKSQHSEDEWTEIVYAELGDYDLPKTIEGFEPMEPSIMYTQTWYAIAKNYTSDRGTYQLRYERDWTDEAHTRSTTREEYESLHELDSENRENIRDFKLGDCDAHIAASSDMGTAIACYDESRDLLFSFWDRSSCLTEEQLLDLAESFIKSINEQ